MKSLLLIFFISALLVGCQSKPEKREPMDEESYPGEFKEPPQLAADRIAFINRQLRLTPEEAKVFWPVYDQYIAEKEQLWKMQHSILFRSRPSQHVSTEQAKMFIDSLLLIDRKMADHEAAFSNRFLEILPPEKVLRMRHAEHRFKRHLLRQFRQQKSKN